MTRIGIVERVFQVHEQLIISISGDFNTDLRIKNGDVIQVGKFGDVVVSGLKFWSEHNVMDVLIEKGDRIPELGEPVYFGNK